ncbi:MAG: RNA polymerase sporulation sigma factor SigK [Firmicutes bacterium]|nr:RNA polymerase sporulation sigma factor SigK [Bacillota bacterium]
MLSTTLLFSITLLPGFFLLISYITNSSAFPQPLSAEEEVRYIIAMEKGDDIARNILVERNLRLVAHVVKKFDNTGEDIDDLISIGTIGLIKAINTYDRHQGTRLATYAARCIENEILMHLRSIKRTRQEVSLNDPIGVDKEGNEIVLLDILGSNENEVSDIIEARSEREKLYEKLKHLSRRERKVIELRYGLPYGHKRTQREIARMLGISRSYVSRIEKRALTKLCQELMAEESGM